MRKSGCFLGLFAFLVLSGCHADAHSSAILVSGDVLSLLRGENHSTMEYLFSVDDSQDKYFHEIFIGTFTEGRLIYPLEAQFLLTFFPTLLFGSFDKEAIRSVRDEYSPVLTYTKIRPVFHQKKGSQIVVNDWEDLLQEGVELVTVDFRYSPIGFFLYFNLWKYAVAHYAGDTTRAENFIERIIENNTVFALTLSEAHYRFNLYNTGNVLLTVEEDPHTRVGSILMNDTISAFISLYTKVGSKHMIKRTDEFSNPFLSVSTEEIQEQEDYWELAAEVHLSTDGILSDIYRHVKATSP